jgi:hypothetical protein
MIIAVPAGPGVGNRIPPFQTCVLEMMHTIRREEGVPLVQERATEHTGQRARLARTAPGPGQTCEAMRR